jgi:hypothetical protein
MARQNLNLNDLRLIALAYEGDTFANTRYGNAQPATGQPSMLDTWINEAQMKMIGELGIQDIYTTTTTNNVRTYAMPLGWTKIKLVEFDGVPLRFCGVIDQDFFDSGTGYCDRYSIYNNQLFLGALPPAGGYSLALYHFREPALLVNATDVPEVPNRFRMALADYAGAMQVLSSAGDIPMVDRLMKKFQDRCDDYYDWIDGQSVQFLQVRNVTDGWQLWSR